MRGPITSARPGSRVAWIRAIAASFITSGADASHYLLSCAGGGTDFVAEGDSSVAQVPWSGTMALLGLGLAAVVVVRKRLPPAAA